MANVKNARRRQGLDQKDGTPRAKRKTKRGRTKGVKAVSPVSRGHKAIRAHCKGHTGVWQAQVDRQSAATSTHHADVWKVLITQMCTMLLSDVTLTTAYV